MTIVLDGALMTERAAAHEYLAKRLNFPEYYGKNLDALYDLLTENSSPLCLVLYRTDIMLDALGDYAVSLIDVLKEAAANNACLEVYEDGI